MELSPSAVLLIAVALVVGYLLRYFQKRQTAPPILYGGKRFGKDEDVKIPATGGTVFFEDENRSDYQIQIPSQIRAREITFRRVEPDKISLPNNVYRILIHLQARDESGPVETFNPYLTIIAKYNESDLKRAPQGDPKRLLILNYHAGAWRQYAMPEGSLNVSDKTLKAYVGTFSSDGIGGDKD